MREMGSLGKRKLKSKKRKMGLLMEWIYWIDLD
jgi:hypothetical protein